MDQSKVNSFDSSLNDNFENSKFGMLSVIVNADDYNCDIFEPIGDDTIFMHLDDFQPAINTAQYSKPRLYIRSTYVISGKFIIRRQSRCWIRIHISTVKDIIMIYIPNYKPKARSF